MWSSLIVLRGYDLGCEFRFKSRRIFSSDYARARVRLLRQIAGKPVAFGVLTAALLRDPSAVRRDVAVLERQHLVKTRKVPNPGHDSRAVVERVALAIELATTV